MKANAVAVAPSDVMATRSTTDWRRFISPATRQGMAAGSWLLLGQAAAAAAQFGFSVMRARALSLEEFGAWSFAAALVSIAGVVADLGLSVVIVRDLSSDASEPRTYVSAVTGLALLLSMAANLLVMGALAFIQAEGMVVLVAAVYGAQMLVNGYGTAPLGYLRARQDTIWECGGRILQAAMLIAGGMAATRLGAGVPGFAAVALMSALLAAVPILGATRRRLGIIRPRLEYDASRRILSAAWPIAIGIGATSVYYYADTVMMGVLGQRRAVALYGADYTLLFGVVLMVSVMHAAFLPILSRAAGTSAAEFRAAARSFLRVSGAAAVCVMAAGPLAAPAVLTLVFGSSFSDGATALRLLMITGGVMFLSSGFGTAILATHHERRYMRVVLAGAAINVALNLMLIPRYSLNGAAAATLAAEVAVCLLMAATFVSMLPDDGGRRRLGVEPR